MLIYILTNLKLKNGLNFDSKIANNDLNEFKNQKVFAL